MNELQIRKGLELFHVLDEHKSLFEQTVIDAYCTYKGTEKWGFHSVFEDISRDMHPMFYLAGIMEEEEEGLFLRHTKGMNVKELRDFSVGALEHMYKEERDPRFLSEMHFNYLSDIENVLEHHRMSYMEVYQNPFEAYPKRVIRNMPIHNVW